MLNCACCGRSFGSSLRENFVIFVRSLFSRRTTELSGIEGILQYQLSLATITETMTGVTLLHRTGASATVPATNAITPTKGDAMPSAINIKVIPHDQQRYDTLGDWQFKEMEQEGIRWEQLDISISQTGNKKYNFLLGLHEFVEAMMCHMVGVTTAMVDSWDITGEGRLLEDPGDDPRAPYHKQHKVATMVEHLVALMMNVDWVDYEEALSQIGQKEPEDADDVSHS